MLSRRSRSVAPRPGLEPWACGLTVRRFRRRINSTNQLLIYFSVGSVFTHLMAVNAHDVQIRQSNGPRFQTCARAGFKPHNLAVLGYFVLTASVDRANDSNMNS